MVFWLKKKSSNLVQIGEKALPEFCKNAVDFQGTMPQIYCSVRWMGIAFLCLRVDSFFWEKFSSQIFGDSWDQKWSLTIQAWRSIFQETSSKRKKISSFILGFFFQRNPKKGQWNLVLSSQRNSWSNYKIATFYHFYSYVKCSNAVSNLR